MRSRLKSIGLSCIAALTLAISLTPLSTLYFLEPAPAQTTQERKAEADRLLKQGNQQLDTSKFEAALQSSQQALTIYREIKDRQGEGRALGNLGRAYNSLAKYDKAIEYHLQSLEIAREIKDRLGESAAMRGLGNAYNSLAKYDKAIEYHLQSLEIAREIKDRLSEGRALGNLGNAYRHISKYDKAIEYYQQSLEIAREIKNRLIEGKVLGVLADTYNSLDKYDKAIKFHLQSLAIARETKDRLGESNALIGLGNAYNSLSKHDKAIEYYQQSLAIAREVKNRSNEGTALGNLGSAYNSLGKYDKAIEFHLQSLAIAREIKSRSNEVTALGNLGSDYNSLAKYDKAIEYYQQSLEIAREIKSRSGESSVLQGLGDAYYRLSKYDKAIEFYQQSLAIAREIKNRSGESSVLQGLGDAYYRLSKYDKAIEFYQQSLAIAREIKNRSGEGCALLGLGNAYHDLGKYDKAIEFYLQHLAIAREIKNRQGESVVLGNLGIAYYSLDKYEKAIEFHLQSLALAREIKDRLSEGNALGNLGIAYNSLDKYDKAIEFHLQSLAIAREIKDRLGEGLGLNNLAETYRKLNHDREAMTSYQESLEIAREIGDRSREGLTLANLGDVLSKAKQPELAILFYKQSVNVREAIRKDLRKLDKDIQKSYLDTVEKTYRNLADLLLKQDRVLEAQQVLDLLKVQELSEYLKIVRGNEQTAKGTDLQRPEQTIIALGNELADLQKLDRDGKLDPSQQQRLAYLTSQESDRNQQFNAFLKSPEVQKQIEQLRRSEQAQNVDIEKFNRLRKSLAQVQNAALLYPLILDDRLELILITATTPPIRRTINLKREVLNAAIVEFRANLRDPSSYDVKQDGQKFYDWLIKPFDAELQQAKVQTIIYAPDGQLRYIPLAALYDGKQWLVEKYRINNITASSLTDFAPRPHNNPRVLAAAATNSQNIQVGDRSISFDALPASKTEVEAIAARIPRTTTLLDRQFSKNGMLPQMQSHTIVHLATHGYFSVSQAEDSFIIFGDGDKATIKDISNWTLTNVDLVVLSACETAIGGKLGNGIEILGLGYQIQNAGAGAAIASLWKVSDDGTQTLMRALYDQLKKVDISPSEALRQAQIATIHSKDFAHPFYWSAFILIGNGL